MIEFTAHSEADTDRLGAALARALPSGTTIALHGTLGAGKTRLVRAVAAASGVDPERVVSPTFVLCHEYAGRDRPIYHFDVYRVADEDEFLELGPDEYFESRGLTFVEWAERVERCLPQSRWDITIEVCGDHSRLFRISTTGGDTDPYLSQLRQELDGM